jgi:hypothetical protein
MVRNETFALSKAASLFTSSFQTGRGSFCAETNDLVRSLN